MSEQVFWDDINEGDSLPIISPDCSTQQLVVWAGASGDFYQIHYDICLLYTSPSPRDS